MARVECDSTIEDVKNERGRLVPGVCVECGRCGHKTRSFGIGEKSIKRCLVMLREECPEGEENFYVEG